MSSSFVIGFLKGGVVILVRFPKGSLQILRVPQTPPSRWRPRVATRKQLLSRALWAWYLGVSYESQGWKCIDICICIYFGIYLKGNWFRIFLIFTPIWGKMGWNHQLDYIPYIPRSQQHDPCFAWKRPCCEGLTFKNRGHWGSRYIMSLLSFKKEWGKWWYPWDGILNHQPYIHLI